MPDEIAHLINVACRLDPTDPTEPIGLTMGEIVRVRRYAGYSVRLSRRSMPTFAGRRVVVISNRWATP